MASIYGSNSEEKLAQISQTFTKYTRYYKSGEDDASEYIDNCEPLLQQAVECGRGVLEAFTRGEVETLPEMDLYACRDMYAWISDAIKRASESL